MDELGRLRLTAYFSQQASLPQQAAPDWQQPFALAGSVVAVALGAAAFAQQPSAPQHPHTQWQSLQVHDPVSQQLQPLVQQAQQPSLALAVPVPCWV